MAAPPPMDEQSQKPAEPILVKVKREKVSLPAAGDEQLRLLLEKPTEGRSWSRSRAAAASAAPLPPRSGGQQTITSYFRGSVAAGAQRKPGAEESEEDAARKTPPVDSESIRGRFGWTSFGNVHVPYIFRQSQRYASVRIIERTLLKKFLRALPTDVYSCTYIKSYYLTNNEANLFNEINRRHCDCQFGTDDFTVKDLVVLLADVEQLLNFLSTCYSKLTEHDKAGGGAASSSGGGTGEGSSRCGFIKLKGVAVPYVSRGGVRYVPSGLIAVETDRTEKLDTWEVSYLKFCCKVAGMRHEFLNSTQSVAVAVGDSSAYEEWWPANCHSHLASESEGQQLKRRRESSTAASGSVITCFLPPVTSEVAATASATSYGTTTIASSASAADSTTVHGTLSLSSPPQPFMFSRQWWGPMTTHSQTCYPPAPAPTTVSSGSHHQGIAPIRSACSCCPPPPPPPPVTSSSSATNILFPPTVIPGPSLTQNASSGQMVPLSRIHNNQAAAMLAYTNGTHDMSDPAGGSSSSSSSSSCASSIGVYRHHPWNQTESTDCGNDYDPTSQNSLSRVFESLQADSSALPMIQSIARIASMKKNYQRSDCATANGVNARKTPPQQQDGAHFGDRGSSGWTESQVVAPLGGGYHSSINNKQSSPKPANQVPASIHGHGSRSGTLREATVMDLTVPKRRYDDLTCGALLLRKMPSPDAAECQANPRPPYKIHKMYLEGAKIHTVNSMPFQYDVNMMATVLEVALLFFPGLSVQTCNQVMAEALRMQLYQCNRMQKELLQKYVNTLLIADQPFVMVTTQELAAFLPQLKLLLNGTVNRNLVNLQDGAGLELAAKRMRLSASGHMGSDVIR